MTQYNKGKIRDISAEKYLLAKKYNDMEKENFRKKLRKGSANENFRAERAWKPGGKAI